MGKGSDFHPGFSFDFGGAEAPTQAPWEFAGGSRAARPTARGDRRPANGRDADGGSRRLTRATPARTAGALKQAIRDEGTFQTTTIDHKIKQHLESKKKRGGSGTPAAKVRCRAAAPAQQRRLHRAARRPVLEACRAVAAAGAGC